MILKSTRPPPRSTHSHSHRAKSSTTPTTHPSARGASSAGFAMPPTTTITSTSTSTLRSPAPENVRTSSPNYFGLTVNPSTEIPDSGVGPKGNWSPPTSSIRSFSAQSPRHIPLDANPEFEAFRRQTELKSGFNLSHGNLQHFASTPGPIAERSVNKSDTADMSASPRTANFGKSAFNHLDVDAGDSSSLGAPSFFDLPRQASPSNLDSAFPPPPTVQRNVLSHLDDRHPRLSLPSNRVDPPSPHMRQVDKPHRADTLPSSLKEGPSMIAASELKDLLSNSGSRYLLLDLRVAPQYAQSRIKQALNLCIPTTLLKRPSFNLEKLLDTFKREEERARFSTWQDCNYIVVYDACSSEKKDATSAVNTLKKFTTEGWRGRACILRGGIEAFSRTYPKLMDYRSGQEMQASRKLLRLDPSMPDVAAVAGGCEMPANKNAANPFFSNIRQNMDLLGGVGRMDIKRPADQEESDSLGSSFPLWLRQAAAKEDHGQQVADKFLKIEQAELSRMQMALSSRVSYGTPVPNAESNVQIAGFEKGGKNRYNNIWPFEHARVRLQGRREGDCDYINASHIKTSWSNKRYIASQGPLPATFEDFWSMIWDHDVRVVVMLTAETEGGQLKCHSYWSAREFGTFKLKALSEKKVSLEPHTHRRSTTRQDSGRRRANTSAESLATPINTSEPPYVIVRKFTLSHSSEPFIPMREITQLHYSSWPDFGAPAQPSHLLGLVELSNSLQRASLSRSPTAGGLRADEPEDSPASRPILVHCSAGCGRTGTFCTVDAVIDMLKRQKREARNGVTPMDIVPSNPMDLLSNIDLSMSGNDEWIFNDSIDLVQATVESFRSQRISMVQSLRQYVLCYETVLEWVSQQQSVGRRERSGSESRAVERQDSR